MSELHLVAARDAHFNQVNRDRTDEDKLDRWWKTWAAGRAHLFNGPMLACLACEVARDGKANIAWYKTTYAHYMQRSVAHPLCTPARALFCSVVLLSKTGSLVIGQMSKQTSSPGRLQLPGGNIESDPNGDVSLAHCADEARREFFEETGLSLADEALELWRIKSGGAHDDVGLIFLCRSQFTDDFIQRTFARRCRDGIEPEFERLIVATPAELSATPMTQVVDYLSAVIALLARTEPEGSGT